ncbi:MAG: hypothetical protein M3Z97_12235 [Candidatus Dormibacteraeota bacterium]|nr:hypothetical protein [Candidatus Dormibacteraeota bacterium]
MDEYSQEINELQAQVDAMIEAEEDKKLIADLEIQLQILRAIYQQATLLLAEGQSEGELRQSLAVRGYGDWTLDNVYAFVYETAVDLPTEPRGSFVGEIRDTDFSTLLRADADRNQIGR